MGRKPPRGSQGPQRGKACCRCRPGRLQDLIDQRHCDLGSVEVCVLDEADHLGDLGFLPAVRRLLDLAPAGGQRLLFSATLDRAVDAIVRQYLSDPIVHSVDGLDAMPAELDHHTFTVAASDKAAVVRELASGEGRSLLFTRTKHAARKLTADLTRHGVAAVDLHGNLSQAQRNRNLAAFAGGSARVLVVHRHRRARHSRGPRRTGRARRPARRTQGVPAPLGPHGASRRPRQPRDRDPSGPGSRGCIDDPPSRDRADGRPDRPGRA